MFLTLEVISTQSSNLGVGSRWTVGREGGIIGRDENSDWVLPHRKVSGLHARVSCQQGAFYVEDRSTNGVYVGPSRERLPRGRPHPLRTGDRLFIEPYEIQVSIGERASISSRQAATDLLGFSSPGPLDPLEDPLGGGDPFAPPQRQPSVRPPRPSPVLGVEPAGDELDPLQLLDPVPGPARRAQGAPTAEDLNRASLLSAHYQPPAVEAPASRPPVARTPFEIPADYDPLAPDTRIAPATESRRERTAPPEPISHPVEIAPEGPPTPPRADPPPRAPTPPPAPMAAETKTLSPAAPAQAQASGAADRVPASGLAEVLEGAGLANVPVTAELARDFGGILHTVVEGVMDVLRARQQVKDEFRMRTTQFRPADNNPLKFSANVEDALHNLLVKRNAAYLGPVEAFDDAFDDLRHHQLAMLSGMRAAFDAMLASFDPDRLQESFDRNLKRGSLVNVPSKLRYWSLYRERLQELQADPEGTFRQIVGEAFANAYEEQLARLKSRKPSG